MSGVCVGEVRGGLRDRNGFDEDGVDHDNIPSLPEREADPPIGADVGYRARLRLSGYNNIAAVPGVRHRHEMNGTDGRRGGNPDVFPFRRQLCESVRLSLLG